jgi:hypothetical protein
MTRLSTAKEGGKFLHLFWQYFLEDFHKIFHCFYKVKYNFVEKKHSACYGHTKQDIIVFKILMFKVKNTLTNGGL